MNIIQALHDSMWRGVFYITGGGASLLSELLAVAGASRTLLDASIPYADRALTDLLGTPTEQAASQATARALSMAAYRRAVDFGGTDHFGFGCTARSGNRPHKARPNPSSLGYSDCECHARFLPRARCDQNPGRTGDSFARGSYSQFGCGFIGQRTYRVTRQYL